MKFVRVVLFAIFYLAPIKIYQLNKELSTIKFYTRKF